MDANGRQDAVLMLSSVNLPGGVQVSGLNGRVTSNTFIAEMFRMGLIITAAKGRERRLEDERVPRRGRREWFCVCVRPVRGNHSG